MVDITITTGQVLVRVNGSGMFIEHTTNEPKNENGFYAVSFHGVRLRDEAIEALKAAIALYEKQTAL